MPETDRMKAVVNQGGPRAKHCWDTRATTAKVGAAIPPKGLPAVPHLNQPLGTYPIGKCRQDRGMNLSQRLGIHQETRRASLAIVN